MLGDKTSLGVYTWADVKEDTLKGYHINSSWYKILPDDKLVLLEELKAAQLKQGNMRELQAGTYNTQVTVPLIDLEEHNLDCDVCPTLDDLLYETAVDLRNDIKDGYFSPEGIAHRLRGLTMMLMAMEIIVTDRPIGVQDQVEVKKVEVALNDQTKIAGTTWERLKEQAMDDLYMMKPWFVSWNCC